jgi:membrane fusion protein (multidrug efflux system)
MTMTDKEHIAPIDTAPPRKRRRWLLWSAGPLLVLAVAAYLVLTGGRFVSTDNAYVEADRVTIAPQVAGRVVEVLVRENEAVKAGDLLFRIDEEPLKLAVERAQAQLAAAGDVLSASRATFSGAEADLRSSTATFRFAEQQYARIKELKAKGLVAQQQLDDAANDLSTKRAKRDADAAALEKARSMLGGAITTPTQQLSGYRVIEAELARARLDLEHAQVRAPIDGVVGKTHLQPGDFLAIGQAAMPLVAAGKPWVDANFKETDLTHVVVGQSATIHVDAYPGREWRAKVASISPASGAEFSVLPAQNATGNWVKIVQRIAVRFDIEGAESGPALRAGMSAEVKIDTGKEHAGIRRFALSD